MVAGGRGGRKNVFDWLSRPFLIQSDLSVENGLTRLKPKSGFHTHSKKRLFRLNFFRLRIPTLAHPVEKLDFFDWILKSKNSVEKVLHVFFEQITLWDSKGAPASVGLRKQSTHDAYENTWKCGELKLYFSPSAGG